MAMAVEMDPRCNENPAKDQFSNPISLTGLCSDLVQAILVIVAPPRDAHRMFTDV